MAVEERDIGDIGGVGGSREVDRRLVAEAAVDRRLPGQEETVGRLPRRRRRNAVGQSRGDGGAWRCGAGGDRGEGQEGGKAVAEHWHGENSGRKIVARA